MTWAVYGEISYFPPSSTSSFFPCDPTRLYALHWIRLRQRTGLLLRQYLFYFSVKSDQEIFHSSLLTRKVSPVIAWSTNIISLASSYALAFRKEKKNTQKTNKQKKPASVHKLRDLKKSMIQLITMENEIAIEDCKILWSIHLKS